jgi:trans-aconitate methyltransferase
MIEQKWDAEAYARHARFVSDLGLAAVELLHPEKGETIIDLGCGDGALTQKIAEAGATAIGIDSDPTMIEATRRLDIEAVKADATDFDLERTVDAVFTNAALHWIADADAVIKRVRAHLDPGGRFVGEFGGHGNIAAISTALRAVAMSWGLGPDCLPNWFFPTAREYRAKLEAAGFQVLYIELIPRQTPVKAGMEAWLEIMTAKTIGKLPVNERPKFVKEVAALLAPSLKSHDGEWIVDYVRLRFKAIVPRDDDEFDV